MKLKNSLCGVLLFVGLVAFAQTKKAGKIDFIVEPYLQQVNDTSFKVLWETSVPGKGFVKLGIAEYNVLKPNLNRSFKGKEITVFHDVAAMGLKIVLSNNKLII
jgi:hypothetical protein